MITEPPASLAIIIDQVRNTSSCLFLIDRAIYSNMVHFLRLFAAFVLAALVPTSVHGLSSSPCLTSSDADYTYQTSLLEDFTFYWKWVKIITYLWLTFERLQYKHAPATSLDVFIYFMSKNITRILCVFSRDWVLFAKASWLQFIRIKVPISKSKCGLH